MRVLVTVDPTIPVPPKLYGGVERMAAGVVDSLRTRGHHVGLLAHPESTQACDAKYGWPEANPMSASAHLANTWALQRSVREFTPDLIHSFSRLLYLGTALLDYSLPKIMSYQRQPTPRTIRWAARAAGRSLCYTGCSAYIANAGSAIAGRWEAIPNFIHPEQLPFVAQVPTDAPLVFLSRVESIKGAHRAIAIARAADRRLIIAGNKADSGPEADYFQRRIAPEIDGDRVQYVGPVNDEQKAALLGRALAMLVPIEWNEPFGIVFIEAMACGTPVISSPRGALPELVTPGREGFLIQSDEEGVEAVRRIGNISRAECRARVEEAFTCEIVVSQYEALYGELLSGTTEARWTAR